MERTNKILPSWISRQAELGPKVSVDGKLSDENEFWYWLTACCPLIFESYAIILNPFWINYKAQKLIQSGATLTENELSDDDFKRIGWKDFFKLFGCEFDMTTAIQTKEKIRWQLLDGGTKATDWPPYIWFPGEGNCETKELTFILSELKNLYGDQIVNYYYCLLKTKKWENDISYCGQLSEFDELKTKHDIRDNPTAIYPDTKEWCINIDYDMTFAYVGGTKELIRNITKNNEFDIIEIVPKFKERANDNTAH